MGLWGREFMGPIPSIHSDSHSVSHSEFIFILSPVLELVERLILIRIALSILYLCEYYVILSQCEKKLNFFRGSFQRIR